jgi:DNA (cytosine-5)-methyltransferase 1
MNKESSVQFLNWLQTNVKMTERSLQDIVSRVRRVSRLLPLRRGMDPETATNRLIVAGEFTKCSPSVRSQLKKSLRLYIQFLNSQ